MLAAPGPHYRSITFITSVSAEMASPERGGLLHLEGRGSMAAKPFALRLAPQGIGVFELRPGIIETAMTAGGDGRNTTPASPSGLVPAGRWGEPADIGRAVVPLATGALAFATGAVIPSMAGLSHREALRDGRMATTTSSSAADRPAACSRPG